jgi:hypothetical protein
VYFVTRVSLYFWNLRKIQCLLTPIMWTLWTNFWDPYIVNDPKWPVQLWNVHWVKTKVFSYSLLLEGIQQTTGVLLWKCEKNKNIKKVKIQPTLFHTAQVKAVQSPNPTSTCSKAKPKWWITIRVPVPAGEVNMTDHFLPVQTVEEKKLQKWQWMMHACSVQYVL